MKTVKCFVLISCLLLIACSSVTLHRVIIQNKQQIPAHEEITPAGPGICCGFDYDMKWGCGYHIHCPERRRHIPEQCKLTVKGDGCITEEIDWPCADFDKIEIGQTVTATIACRLETSNP